MYPGAGMNGSGRGYAEKEDSLRKLYSIEFSIAAIQSPMARIYLQEGAYDGEYLLIGQCLESLELLLPASEHARSVSEGLRV